MPKRNPQLEKMAEEYGKEFRERLLKEIKSRATDDVDTQKWMKPGVLAKATGLERSVVSRILSGERYATIEQMFAIARALPFGHMVLPGELWLGIQPPDEEIIKMQQSESKPSELASLPSSLVLFFGQKGAELEVTEREEWYLKHVRVQTESSINPDPEFWEDLLVAIRGLLFRSSKRKSSLVDRALVEQRRKHERMKMEIEAVKRAEEREVARDREARDREARALAEAMAREGRKTKSPGDPAAPPKRKDPSGQ